ncbi:MAG: hypothetical protein ACKO2P_05635 [Planctomycetota bacterium]
MLLFSVKGLPGMAAPEPTRSASTSLLHLSTTLLTVALACGLGLLFILNLPPRKQEGRSGETATFKGDPLFVVQFPRFEAEPVGDSVRDVSQSRRQPIPERLPALNPPAPAPVPEPTPEFTAAERMFEVFPSDGDGPTELQPEFEPEPAPVARRNPPRPATGRGAAMQPRGVVSTPRMPLNRLQPQPADRPQARPQRWPNQTSPYDSHPHPMPTFEEMETDSPDAAFKSVASREAELAAELRTMKEQLSRITRQLAAGDSAKVVASPPTPKLQPVSQAPAPPTATAPASAEPLFDPVEPADTPAAPVEATEPEFVPEPRTADQPELPAEPAVAPPPTPAPAETPDTFPQPLPEPEPQPQPTQPEPAPAVAPVVPSEPVEPAPVDPVSPAIPDKPATPADAATGFVAPQPTEPVVRAVAASVFSSPMVPDERMAGMRPVPPPTGESGRSMVRDRGQHANDLRSLPLAAISPAVRPFHVTEEALLGQRMPATASSAPPWHGGTVWSGSDRGNLRRSQGNSGAMAGIRESVSEGLEELPRPGVLTPAWLRNLFGGRKPSERQTVAKRGGLPGADRSSTVSVPSGGLLMFAEKPRSGVERASATISHGDPQGAIRRASHVAVGNESAAGAGRQQTQYRSLRDGHNKPGRLFDPHAWTSPKWLED